MGCTQSVPQRDNNASDAMALLDSHSDRGMMPNSNNKPHLNKAAYNTATVKGATNAAPEERPRPHSNPHHGGGGGGGKKPSSHHNGGGGGHGSKPHYAAKPSNSAAAAATAPPKPAVASTPATLASPPPPSPRSAAHKPSHIPLNPAPGPNFKAAGANGGTGAGGKLPSTNKPINRAVDRTDAIEKAQTVTCGGVTMTYAYLSQRGFYPDDPFKANQDAYCVQKGLRDTNDAFFGVFDGHGKDGDGCAIYAKLNLPPNLANILKRTPAPPTASGKDYLSKDQIQAALLKAHVDVNKGLHKNAKIDDTLSGTTAISLYFHGGKRNRITIANVGDSRAVLGTLQGTGGTHNPNRPNNNSNSASKSLKALPLSRDQTPYRKDERQRVKAAGARVLSLDQLEGLEPILDGQSEGAEDDFELGEDLDEGGDPPRVWHPQGDYPGTAFTRSIGDSVAEELGVYAEPEMLTREVSPEDKIIVLASDGVFEFLTNQSVIDICAKFSDPLEACRAVVAEAYELWLQYELRTDDITIICIFVDQVVGGSGDRRGSLGDQSTMSAASGAAALAAASGTAASHNAHSSSVGTASSATSALSAALSDDDLDNSVLTSEGLRPVRKHASKEKSKAIAKWKELGKTLHGTDPHDDEAFDWKVHATEKTEEEKRSISDAIKASVMFRNTNEEQRQMIYACMESVSVKAGTWVIQQGSVGDRFYIVDEGQFEVRIVPDGEDDETGQGGHIVHIYEGSREKHAHPSFGELALVHSMPRSASVVAKTDGHLWALHRAAFRQVLVEAQDHRKELKRVLGEIPYFQYLDSDAINKLATIMDEVTFGRGETMVNQDQPGDFMYVIASGSAYGVQMLPGETKRSTYKAGSHFGDEIFSTDRGRYSTTVVTMQTTICWQLDQNVMKQTMGPLLRQGGP